MKILIVEDNEVLAQTTGWVVESFGYEYCCRHTGAAALETAKTWVPDVVIMDIGLPEMNGYEVCRRMREAPHLSQTIYIAQTGRSDSEDRRQALEAGFHHHLVKPAGIDTLQTLLKDIETSLRVA